MPAVWSAAEDHFADPLLASTLTLNIQWAGSAAQLAVFLLIDASAAELFTQEHR